MRFSLVDLLLAELMFGFATVACALAARLSGHPHLTFVQLAFSGAGLGAVLYLFLTPPIYRRCRMLPLFLPKCPHCEVRPVRYGLQEIRWPRMVVICAGCNEKTELWWQSPATERPSGTMPSLLLCWPQSIGRWRLIARGGDGNARPPDRSPVIAGP